MTTKKPPEVNPLQLLGEAAVASDVPEAEVAIGELSAPGALPVDGDHEFGEAGNTLADYRKAGCYRLARGEREYDLCIGVNAFSDMPPSVLAKVRDDLARGIERELS